MSTPFEPVPQMEIQSIEALKVLADERRMQLLDAFKSPQTVKAVAAALALPANRLYYHIRQLEAHNMLVVVDTREVSGIVEKTYQTAAVSFTISSELQQLDGDAATSVFLMRKMISYLENNPAEGIRGTFYVAPEDEEALLEKIRTFFTALQAEYPQSAKAARAVRLVVLPLDTESQ